ncbi:MAG: hypothetical protein R3C97_01405 [Geminicoccaceae bacterium]
MKDVFAQSNYLRRIRAPDGRIGESGRRVNENQGTHAEKTVAKVEEILGRFADASKGGGHRP